jgi:N-acyl-L-homoserine lactone synthetase
MGMHVVAVTRAQYGAELDLLAGMHRLRYRVFKDRLSWTVSVTGDKEIDRYDGLGPTYILVVSAARDVLGAVRLLPTLGPHMLADTFPDLLQRAPVPRSETYLEASRFCVDTVAAEATGSGGLNRVTMLLLWGVADWSLATGADAITAVTDLRMERILRRAGWPMVRPPGIDPRCAARCADRLCGRDGFRGHPLRHRRPGCRPGVLSVRRRP